MYITYIFILYTNNIRSDIRLTTNSSAATQLRSISNQTNMHPCSHIIIMQMSIYDVNG